MKHNFDEFKVGNWYYETLNKRVFECVKICGDYIFPAGCNNTTCMTLEYIKSRPCYEIESPYATFRKGDTVYRSDDDSFHYLSHDNWNYYKNSYQNSYILKRKDHASDFFKQMTKKTLNEAMSESKVYMDIQKEKSLDLSLYDDDYYTM